MSGGWPYPRVVAHRGGGALAPENTLGAMRKGALLGFRGVEFDVMLAGDGTPVVIHDETIDRTTNGKGEVSRMNYSQISAFRTENGERVPTYADTVALCRELGLWANVEIKPAKGYERATGEAVARVSRELWRGAPVMPELSSFSVEALDAAQGAAPEFARGYLVGRVPDDWRATMARLGCVALHCNWKALTPRIAREAHDAGYGIALWTVDDPADARRLLAMGADCIITDALDRIAPDFS